MLLGVKIIAFLITLTGENQKHHIVEQISKLNWQTCVRWIDLDENNIDLTNYTNFVKIRTDNVCYQTVKKTNRGYVSYVSLSDGCFTHKSAVLHEMLHVMGFDHEHQRSNRDCYIDVHKDAGKSERGKVTRYQVHITVSEVCF